MLRAAVRSFVDGATRISQARSYGSSASSVPEVVTSDERGKKKLAELMGEDDSSFSEDDVQHALRYLLPTRLTAKDARPFLKHSSLGTGEAPGAGQGSVLTQEPIGAAFYTGSPSFYGLLGSVFQHLARMEEKTIDTESAPNTKRAWLKKTTLEHLLAEEIAEQQYTELIDNLNCLAKWENCPTVREFLETYRQPPPSLYKQNDFDEETSVGSHTSVGKRKSSTAIVTLKKGSGETIVNGRILREYFPRADHRQQVLYPLLVTDTLGVWDITARVTGGGITGQAGAIRLGISKALLHHGNHGDELGGLVVRDSRSVERKKPGQKKARKKFAWVKR